MASTEEQIQQWMNHKNFSKHQEINALLYFHKGFCEKMKFITNFYDTYFKTNEDQTESLANNDIQHANQLFEKIVKLQQNIDHHHYMEETYVFPKIAELSQDFENNILKELTDQHKGFEKPAEDVQHLMQLIRQNIYAQNYKQRENLKLMMENMNIYSQKLKDHLEYEESHTIPIWLDLPEFEIF